MATSINFPQKAHQQVFWYKAERRTTLSTLSSKIAFPLEHNSVKIEQQGVLVRRQAKNRPTLVVSSTKGIDLESSALSASDAIRDFYACINNKDLELLAAYISDDCCYVDCSFPQPFQGKEEVVHFFKKLMASMGQNIKFCIDHICEGDECAVGVNWHLEWNRTQVPFTRGCSFYEYSIDAERLLIKKAQVVLESPIKPGSIVLTLLKNLTLLTDEFPQATEWFQKRSHIILLFLMKIYNMLLAPTINHILAGYKRIWNFLARLLGFAFSIVIYILKVFFQ